ncbi:glycosyltransferase family 39 protein [Candidatus Pacearchaeota archaeon]|nr:glycosyltransferase family 39 protein [Candidatus Pacearchaeota archaeon]
MKKNLFFIGCIIFLLFLAVIIYSVNAPNFNSGSPDEVVLKTYSKLYSESGQFYIFGDINKSENTLRGTININNKIIPLKFLGYIIFLGGLIPIIPYFSFYFTALTAIIGIFYAYKISFLIFKNNIKSIMALGLLIFLPFFWYWTTIPFIENVSATSFFIVGLYYLLKIFEDSYQKISYYLLSGIFFGLSIGFRYDLALAFLCFGGSLAFFNIKKLNLINLIIFFSLFFLFISPSLIESKFLYGSFFTYGEKIIENKIGLPQRSLSNILEYIIALITFIPIFFIFILSFFYKPKLQENKKIYYSILLALLIYTFSFLYILVSQHPLNESNILHISYTRYFLLFFILSTILLANFVGDIKNNKIKILFIFVTIILFTISTPLLINSRSESIKKGFFIRDQIISETPIDSIIIVKYSDKFIYGFRNSFAFGYFEITKGEVDYKKAFDELEKFKDYNLFLYSNDFNDYPILQEFKNQNYQLLEVNKTLGLYKINKK